MAAPGTSEGRVQLQEEIRVQGNVVRSMKKDNKPKEEVCSFMITVLFKFWL